ncbi:30S ribosomal protein S24e [Methanobacterium alcaliphilum]|uniref:30S ribosomal protein S24e n=1 Tax=Methanobacterium alcaliphilum TaxID=392018 RepID=UPI00200B0586|nr:30S ribosomal protein S24e [Methanobacterium alcaliphilum]MCK9151764.1 30S ribosomal protein S24e [Methanobacterium alcaliphilum]
MEINIIKQNENPLLNRTEITFECLYQGEATPKISNVKNKLVAMLDADKNLLVVDKVKPHFGEGKAEGYAKIYGSEDSLKDIETEHVMVKNQEAKAEEESQEE